MDEERLGRTFALREMVLTQEAADALDRLVEKARTTPCDLPTRRMEERGPEFLLDRPIRTAEPGHRSASRPA